jgi:conjugative element/phage-associated large polyvalent protein
MPKSSRELYYAVQKRKRKTEEEKEYTQYLNFTKQKSFREKVDKYNSARKEMGLQADERPTADKVSKFIGDEKRGDLGEYGRWQKFSKTKEQKEKEQKAKIQGPPTPKKLDVNNQWADRRKEIAPKKPNALEKTWSAIKSVGKGVDKYALKPVDRFVAKMTDTATFGLASHLEKKNKEALEKKIKEGRGDKYDRKAIEDIENRTSDKGRGKVGKASDFVAQGVGYLAPGFLAAKGARAVGLGAKLTKGMSRTKKIGQLAKEGATVGAAISLAETPFKKIDDKETNEETIKRIALETGLGAIGDPLAHGVGKIASKYLSKVKARAKTTGSKATEKEVASAVEEIKKSRFNPTKRTGLKGVTRANEKTTVQEIIRAMEEKGFKTGKTSPKIDAKKFDAIDKKIENNQWDMLREGYKGEQRPRHTADDLEQMAKDIGAERQKVRDVDHYQERYNDLRRYVDENYPKGTVQNDETLREAWTHIARREEDFDLDELVNRAFPKGFDERVRTQRADEPIEIQQKHQAETDARIREVIGEMNKPYEPQILGRTNREEVPQIPDSPMNIANRSVNDILERVRQNRATARPLEGIEQVLPTPRTRERVQAENIDAPPLAELDPTTAPLSKVVNPDAKPLPENYDATQHFREQIVEQGDEQLPLKERMAKARRKLYRQLVDKKAELGRMDKAAGRNMIKGDTAIAQAHRQRGSGAKANQELEDGFYNKNGQKTGEGYRDTFRSLQNVDETMAYMAAKRVQDYEAREMQGIDPGEYAQKDLSTQAIKQFEESQPHLKDEAKKVSDFMDNQLGVLKEGGIFNDEQLKQLKADNPNFLPFERDRSDILESFNKQGGGMGSPSKPLAKRTGSTRKILNPAKTIMKRQYIYNNIAAKNKTNQAILENIAALGNDNEWATVTKVDKDYAYKIPREIEGETVEQDLTSYLDDMAQDSDEAIAEGLADMFGKKSGDANMIYAYKDGDRYQIQIKNPELSESLQTANREDIEFFHKFITAPTNLLRWGVTISPDFAVRNIFRDQFTTALSSRVGYKPFIDAMFGAAEVLKSKAGKSELVDAYVRNGGSQDSLMRLNQEDVKKGYDDLMRDKNVRNYLKDLAKNPFKLIDDTFGRISQFGEEATRIGHMRRALKHGEKEFKKAQKQVAKGKMTEEEANKKMLDIEDATYIARAALDFSRNGSLGQRINEVVPFFNATIQGMDVMARAFKDKPIKSAVNTAALITMPSLALHYLNKDQEWYQEIPQEDRDKNWYINSPQLGQVIKIPKPFEPGVLFGTGMERAYDKWAEGDKDAFEGYGKALFETLSPSVLPQMLKPMLEVITDHNFYTGQGIESEVDRYRTVPERKTVYTSHAAELLSKGIYEARQKAPNVIKDLIPKELSPKKIDHLIRGYGGTMVDQINRQVVDRALEGVMKDVPERPSKGLQEVPFASAFVQKNLEGNNQSTNKFYEITKKLQEESKSVPEGKTYEHEKERLAMNKTMRAINKLQGSKRDIQNDKDMSGKKKAEEIKKLNKQITDMARKSLAENNFKK